MPAAAAEGDPAADHERPRGADADLDPQDDGSDRADATEELPEDRWIDGLLTYWFRGRIRVFSDPRNTLVSGVGTGVWSAGEVLADYFLARPGLCRGACLELGAGVGVVGLSLAALGAGPVVLTDAEGQMPLTRRNAEENFKGRVHCETLDWTVPEQRDGLAAWRGTWSLIVASDVGYDADLHEPLLLTLLAQCGPETVVYIALADREEEEEPDVADFLEALHGRFEWEQVHVRQMETFQSVTKVLRLRPTAASLTCAGKRKRDAEPKPPARDPAAGGSDA